VVPDEWAVGAHLRSGKCEFLPHPLQHATVDVIGVFLPAEHAHRRHTVEIGLTQGREELVPGDFAVADLVVLVDPDVGAGRVDDASFVGRSHPVGPGEVELARNLVRFRR